MSRLDDELRKALRREQPSADFTVRLLERVARQPEPKPRWWQRFATLLDPPKLRWVAIGVTASLLLAIGAAQYSRFNQTSGDKEKVAIVVAPPEPGVTAPEQPTALPERYVAAPTENSRLISKRSNKRGSRPGNRRLAATRAQQERELRAEGEAAKESLMFALSIASSALSDAQKAVHDDALKP